MAKGTITVNPKLTLMRKASAKAAPAFRRAMGEMARIQANPTHGPKMFDDTCAGIMAAVAEVIEGAQRGSEAPLPANGWVVEPISGRRNFLHARQQVSILLGYFEQGQLMMAGVYFPAEDLLVHAASGAGLMGPERLRVAGRADLADSLLMLPLKTIDAIELKLLEKYDVFPVHTRKSGHPVSDIIEVCAGRADASIGTRLTPLEAAISRLFVAESGGLASTLPHQGDDTLLASNPKLHAKFLDVLK